MAVYFIFLVAGTDRKLPDVFTDRAKARAKQWTTDLIDGRKKSSARAKAGDIVRFVLFKCKDNTAFVAELELKKKDNSEKVTWHDLATFSTNVTADNPSKFVVMPSAGQLIRCVIRGIVITETAAS